MRVFTKVAGVALLAGLTSCDNKPVANGQVVATVNGDEITRPELNAELPRQGNATDEKQIQAIRNAVLDQLVMQRLVVQEAKRVGLDRTQEYLLASRRANDQILSDLLSRRIVQQLRTPYAQDVDRFVRENPTRFGQRLILLTDQISFADGALSDAQLKTAKSLDVVLAMLSAAKIKFSRARPTVDTATLAPPAFVQLQGLAPGEPFIVREGGVMLVSAIIGRQPAPVTGAEAKRLATRVIQQRASQEALVKQLETLRKGAQVSYQPGFGPPRAATIPSAAGPSQSPTAEPASSGAAATVPAASTTPSP